MTLVAPPALTITVWLLVLLHRLRFTFQAAGVAAWTLLLLSTFATPMPGGPVLANVLVGLPHSDELWTTALQSPEQRLVRRQRLTDAAIAAGNASGYQLHVRYAWDGGGAPPGMALPEVQARINGRDLPSQIAGTDLQEQWCCTLLWRVPVDGVRLDGQDNDLAVWLPRRDARVRFIAQRNPFASRFGPGASLFFDGSVERRGVPHTHSGTLREGFLHMWLEPAP